MGVCNQSMFCCTLLYVHSSFAIILMGKRELVALLGLSCWCLVIVVWLFLAVPWVCQQFMIVIFPDHTHYFVSFEARINNSRIKGECLAGKMHLKPYVVYATDRFKGVIMLLLYHCLLLLPMYAGVSF